jgi:uncharacterized phage protein (TIGR02220 family)
MLKWEWYLDVNTKSVFLHMLLTAQHEDILWRGIELKRGQVVVGRKKLAKDLGLSERQIRTSITRLKSTNEIATYTTNKYTLVTITKYEDYQNKEASATNKTTNKTPTSDQQTTTNKNVKNDKNIKIYTPVIEYLNQKAGAKYKPSSQKTKSLIDTRVNDGFTLDDFKTVIDKKVSSWKDDLKMSVYLRPETLFGNKFEGYLNEKVIKINKPPGFDYDQRNYAPEHFEKDRERSDEMLEGFYESEKMK